MDLEFCVEEAIELMTVPGEATREGEIATYLRKKILDMGIPKESIVFDAAHEKSEHGGETGNLIVQLKGNGQGDRKMMCTHMDTVPSAVGSQPGREGCRVVNLAEGKALGADARAGCAVVLNAIRALLEREGEHSPWTFVFFVQEEIGLVGSRFLDVPLLGEPKPVMCFNIDGSLPTDVENEVIGTERMHITLRGVASHSSRPSEGISAAVIHVHAMARMVDQGWHGAIEKLEGEGFSNLGILKGGTGSNVLMPELYILMEARSHNKEFKKKILETWRNSFEDAVKQANEESAEAQGTASVEFKQGPFYDPYALSEDTPVVQAAFEAIRRIGMEPTARKDNGGQDSAWIYAHRIPAVGLGFGGRQAHSVDEWLDITDFRNACRIAAELVAE